MKCPRRFLEEARSDVSNGSFFLAFLSVSFVSSPLVRRTSHDLQVGHQATLGPWKVSWIRFRSLTYADSGVDIDAAGEAKKRIRKLARTTFSPAVLTDIGSFGALFKFDKELYEEPLLVSSCDGVGTKLKVAVMTGRHDTVGYDLVSHCISDIMVQGARPLFFLDYIACGKMDPGIVEQVVAGLVRACRETGCALIGGETAEMPDFYVPGEYDLAGFIVGVVDRKKVVDGQRIRPGDRVLGLASLGLHTNGYSLARKIFFDRLGHKPDDLVASLKSTVADVLLAPHRNYFPLVEPLLNSSWLKGMAHITGGGITENLPRILPPGAAAPFAKAPGRFSRCLITSGPRGTSTNSRCFARSIWGSE